MLTEQNNYDFKSELLVVHETNVRDYSIKKSPAEFEFVDGVKIFVANSENEVVMTAVRDFEDYLFTSHGVSAFITKNPKGAEVTLSLSKNLGEAEGYMGYRLTVTNDNIKIEGHDDRGIAQGLYYLEDLMNIKKAPIVKPLRVERKALFSPRITQSPFGMFEWNDTAFKILAHRGFDAIDLWLKDPWTSKRGDYIDIRLIAERAKKYGIDVYVELYAPHTAHPDDEGAQEFYDQLYGEFFKVCPIIKGLTLVGEATNFASRDPRVGLVPHSKNFVDNIPTGKISPGWFPCCDYPAWVSMIKNSVRKYSKTAEIMFCTYNWGFAPEEDRIKLIEALPDDITVLATWDMFEKLKTGESTYDICDYSLSFVGPGKYFISEATAVMKKKGIKMSTIANTSGRTWDFGTVPYEPMPEQWIKRYKNFQKAHDELELRGLVENIHYGFHPSIITDLEKQAFFSGGEPLEDVLMQLIERDFGKENAKDVKKATELFSEAITHYVPTNEDQYGGYRTGPQYPLWSGDLEGLPSAIPDGGIMPANKHAMHKKIYFGVYTADNEGRNSLPGVRIYDELKATVKVENFMQQGIEILEKIKNPNDKLSKLILLAKFIRNSCRTVINVKEHYITNQQLSIVGDKKKANELIDKMEEILLRERENVLDTIPVVKLDSRLGWEPSMEYTTDEKGLRWKLRQLDY
jgi:hypothetical protein